MGESRRGNFIHTVFKMNVTTWLSLVIAVIALATPANTSEPRVVCYYTNWSVYRPGAARFNPQNINPYLCTHLVYAFGGFTKDNALKPFDRYQDIEKGGYAKFTGLKTYNKKLKTMLAIGGWNEGSTRFSPMVAARDRRKEFVRNAIKFLRQNHFDGLDLDWEYPAFRDGGKPKDRENYAKLVKELREEFEREAEKTGKPRLLLTMAVPAGIEYIQKGFDVQTLNQYLDWMNLLTYDYHSAFEPAVNHHAPLYPLEEPNEYSVDTELNIDYTIKFYLENGADRDKLVLGIPTYGRSYTLFNPDAVEIGAPADGPGEQGDATREKGYLAYYEICEALKPKTKKRSARSEEDSEEDSEEEEEEEEWTVTYPNAKAMGPVAYKGNQWVGYDDIEIVKRKAEYVAENGLGGIMFWSIDNDDFRGTCHDKPYPLIEAAKEAYIVSLGSTDNAIVTERASPARSSSRRRSRPRSSTTTTTAKPSTAAKIKSNNRKNSVTSTTPAWNVITPEPPTTPDPGSDFKCTDEGFFPHPRDCKKYFWCLDSGPSNLGIVAHQFTCPSGLFFNKAADSCDFARNVLCKKPSATTKAPTTKAPTTTTTPITTTTTRRPVKLSTRNSLLFRTSTTTTTTTTTTPEPESEEYSEEQPEDSTDIEAEDPKVIKELIDLIKKVGGVEQLEKHLRYGETSASTDGAKTTTPSVFNKKLYQKVLERTRGKTKSSNTISEGSQNSRRGPQNAGLEPAADKDRLLRKDRPQYTTINRSRPSTQAPEPEESEEEEDISEEQTPAPSRARAVEPERSVATTAKPLQYVNIRRARPTTLTTSDTADDTASRNALFERSEPYVTVSDSSNSLDIVNARRENIPEYVTIRRQRPTTEEATTVPYENTVQETESQDTVLEREISSQPQYTSILRARSTTEATIEEPSSPEPTTVLAVQISSLLNTPNSAEDEEETSPAEVEITETTSASTTTTSRPTTTTTTTTTTPAPPSPPRRTVLRRRGSTTTTTAAPTSAPTTQSAKDRRTNFLRRTKATAPPLTTDTDTVTDTEATTKGAKPRRGPSKFQPRKKAEAGKGAEPERPGGARRSERPTRTFVRRRLGGANSTSTTTTPTTPTASGATRRPFRVASRRRPLPSPSSTTTTTEGPTDPTAGLASEESLQDIEDTDVIEDPTLDPQVTARKKVIKIPRRPLVNLKEEVHDQNPSATNEDERKRQSKKYSSSFKQNQLDKVLRQKAKSSQEEIDDTTERKTTAFEDFNPETAVAIAAHQLLAAPIPIIPNFDEEEPRTTKKSKSQYTTQYYSNGETEPYTNTGKTVYFEEFTSTPVYKSSTDYVATGSYTGLAADFDTPKAPATTSFAVPKSTYSTSTFAAKERLASPTPTIINTGLSGIAPTNNVVRTAPPSGFSRGTSPLSNAPVSSTPRFASTSEKLIPVPVEDYAFSTGGYSPVSQEPTYFTREYLLESPVTKTYDDEYQYLSPVTTPITTTRKAFRKKIQRKISTTIKPTTPALPAVTTTKAPPRRVPAKTPKPFEKVKGPPRVYKPIENYDYYDDSQEKVAEKYSDGETKVVLHGKGTIECLDIGNFPHPTSCKKFISCSRMETGSIIGWEYICPKGLSFDPVGGICNWSAGLGCDEKDV